MSIFEDLIRSLNPVVARVFHKGYFECWDEYNRATVPLGAPGWAKTARGHAIYPGGVAIAHGAEQQSTEYTMLVGCEGLQFNGGLRQRLISKRGVSGTTFGFFTRQDIVRAEFYDGASLRPLTIDWRNYQTAGAIAIDGQATEIFFDGISVGFCSGASTIAPETSPVNIGMFYSGDTADQLVSPITFGVLFADVLTAAQIAEIHDKWLEYQVVIRPARRQRFVASVPRHAVERWELGRSEPTIVGDIAGIGIDRDVGIVSRRGQVLSTRGDVQGKNRELAFRAIDSRLDNPSKLTISCILSARSAGGFNYGRWYSKPSATEEKLSYVESNGRIVYWVNVSGGGDYRYGSAPLGVIKFSTIPQHVMIVDQIDGLTLPKIFIDGEDVGVVKISGALGTPASNDSGPLLLGMRGLSGRAWDGTIEEFVQFDQALNSYEQRQEYVRVAQSHTDLWNRYQTPISLAAISSGRVGPFTLFGGTHDWVDDGIRRGVKCVTNGALWVPSLQPYGAWYFRASKGTDGGIYDLMLVASKKGGLGETGQTGYAFRIAADESVSIVRAPSTTILSSASGYVSIGTEYEVFVTRTSGQGTWRIWLRGGAYEDWTEAGTATKDDVTQKCRYICPDLDQDDTLMSMSVYPIGGSLVPWEILR